MEVLEEWLEADHRYNEHQSVVIKNVDLHIFGLLIGRIPEDLFDQESNCSPKYVMSRKSSSFGCVLK